MKTTFETSTTQYRAILPAVVALLVLIGAFSVRADEPSTSGVSTSPVSEEQRAAEKIKTIRAEDNTSFQRQFDFRENKAVKKVLPPVKTSNAATLSGMRKIMVKRIQLRGNTLLKAEQVKKIIRPRIGRMMTMEELHAIGHLITEIYVQNGYVNSGVVIPDQKVENETVIFQVVEGELTEIQVSGVEKERAVHVKNLIFSDVRKPLRMQDIHASLRKLQQDPMIRRVAARLNPGLAPGQSVLNLQIGQAAVKNTAYALKVGVNNHRSPSIGAEQLTLGFDYRIAYGAVITANLGISQGFDNVEVDYLHPLKRRGESVRLSLKNSNSIVVEAPFDQIDIESSSRSVDVAYTYPLRSGPEGSWSLNGGLEIRHNESTLLSQPFSFSVGAVDGASDTTVLHASTDWVSRSPGRIIALKGGLRLGVPALDATENSGSLPSGEFTVLQAQAQWVQRLKFLHSRFGARSTLQYAIVPLLSLEKTVAGGAQTVRGYRENSLVRDNVLLLSTEWRLPLLQKRGGIADQRLQLVTFVDFAQAWDKDEAISRTVSEGISSLGLGLTWKPLKSLYTELFYASALDDLNQSADGGLQDQGLHFKAVYKYQF